MPTHRRLFHTLSILVILTMFFSGITPSPASAQGGRRAIISSSFVKGSSDATQSHDLTLAGATWYVSPTGSDSNTCSVPALPCATIEAAVATAASGDVIKVQTGTYTGSGTEVVSLSKAVSLSGGWNADFSQQKGYSTIDGQNSRQGIFIAITGVSIARFIVQNCIESGIYIDYWGGATVDKSIIMNNFGSHGGGINNSGILVLNNSSVHHNTADSMGGGINNLRALTINNSTISYNSAHWSGAIHASPVDASVSLNNVTIGNNTASFRVGGISASSTGNVTLQNTILANNTGSEGQDCSNKLISQGYNIIENLENCTVTPVTGDKFSIDPGLGQLNPALGLQPLLVTSPAIDAGNPAAPGSGGTACLAVDQREAERPLDGPDPDLTARCDIGAYEYTIPGTVADLMYFSGSPQVVTPGTTLPNPMKVIALDNRSTPVPGVPVKFTAPASGASGVFAGSGTKETTMFTNADGVATAPVFTANTLKGSYDIVASHPNAASSVAFAITNGYWIVATNGNDGNVCSSVTSPCATLYGVFQKPSFSSGQTIRMGIGVFGTAAILSINKDTTISGGWDPAFNSQIGTSTIEDPIGTYRGTQVVLENLTIRNNMSSAGLTNGGTMTLRRSAVINNYMGIDNDGTLTIVNSTISGNGMSNPVTAGGGIENTNSEALARITIINSTITNNKRNSGGAGIYNASTAAGQVTLQNSIVAGNLSATGHRVDCEGGNGEGSFISLGYNIVGSIGVYNGVVYNCKGNWVNTDLVGIHNSPADPGLNTLADVGNNIWMHALKANSPAVDGVLNNNCPLTDQRSVPRPQKVFCDIGSHELGFVTISGNAGAAGVILSYRDGVVKTAISLANGQYSFHVKEPWSGTVTPSKSSYIFAPVSRTYTNVTTDQASQNYTATALYTISGNVGVAGVTLSYMYGTPKTVTSQLTGSYSLSVPSGWVGAVTPTHPCFTFSPASRNYNNLTAHQSVQDFTPTLVPATGCASLDVSVGGAHQGRFGLLPQGSTRVSFPGLNSGPVKIESTNAVPVIGAERLIYKVNNVATSFTEMMGLPNGQVDTTYWLPWYNNVELDTQLRFANVSGQPAIVHVFIGGNEMTGSPFTLAVGESTRKSFAGVNAGPVQIVSDHGVPIVAAERLLYKVNGVAASFSETMAVPNSQVDTMYWLPWYNNAELDTQLRFANVTDQPATVHVYIGGAEMTGSPFTLAVGESTRKSFAGVNAGPVQIVSDHGVPIVAAERLIYKVNNVATSFTEMMAQPNGQLNTTYWLPWYNNNDLDTQLRFANVHDTQTATVHVLIGGVEMTGSPFTLLSGASTRKSFPGINAGPVQIVSDVPIVAAERLIYKVNNIPTSFSEMLALPDSQLDTLYWLPWYNNVDLDTQLRFGVP